MAKVKISEFSANPANNTDIDGINIAENCPPSGINDAIRELMAQLKDFQTGAVGDSFNGPVGTTTAAAGAFTTLTTSSTVTLSGGTANGVPYLNGSKVLTSGSALTFTGSSLNVTATDGVQVIGGGLSAYFYADAVGGNISVPGNNVLRAYVNGSEQMRLTSTGLGIGTSSPGSLLSLYKYQSDYGIGLYGSAQDWAIKNVYSAGGALQIANNGGTRATIDSSGNLGLGVTPSAAVSNNKFIGINGATAWSGYNAGGVYAYSLWGNAAAGLSLNGGKASEFTWDSNSGAFAWRLAGSSTAGAAISFTQAMTLDASGNLLVGTTSTGFTNSRSFTFQGLGDGKVYVNHSTANMSGDGYIGFGYNGTQIGSITQSGTTAVAYNTSSDYRLKENIQPMTGALAKVAALKPVTYTWKADGSAGEGFIAHELAEVCPAAVTGEKDAVDAEGNPQYQGIDVSFLVATLTAGLQEQQAIIEDMKTRLAAAGI